MDQSIYRSICSICTFRMRLKIRLNANRIESKRNKPNHVRLKSTKAFPLLLHLEPPSTWSQTPAKLNEKYPFCVRCECFFFFFFLVSVFVTLANLRPNCLDYFRTSNIVGKKQFYFTERILSNTKGFSMHELQLIFLF